MPKCIDRTPVVGCGYSSEPPPPQVGPVCSRVHVSHQFGFPPPSRLWFTVRLLLFKTDFDKYVGLFGQSVCLFAIFVHIIQAIVFKFHHRNDIDILQKR